jgi:hypothetical protein
MSNKIFESPDNGKTVYVREFGELPHRTPVEDEATKSLIAELKEDQLWGEIRQTAKTNAALHDLLNQAIMTYNLIKKQ